MTVSGIAISLLSHGFLDTMLVAMLPISIAGSLSLDKSSDISQESLQGITYMFTGTAFVNTFCITTSFYYRPVFYFLLDTLVTLLTSCEFSVSSSQNFRISAICVRNTSILTNPGDSITKSFLNSKASFATRPCLDKTKPTHSV